MSDAMSSWLNRWSRLCRVDGAWQIYIPSQDGLVHLRPWRWWNPIHLVRLGLHKIWARRYW